MIFQREKKELWRYASKNHAATASGMMSQRPLLHRPQHQRPPQRRDVECASSSPSARPSASTFATCCGSCVGGCTSSPSMQPCGQQVSTPLPPYNSVPALDWCRGPDLPASHYDTNNRQQDQQQQDQQQQQQQQSPPPWAADWETETSTVSAAASDKDIVPIHPEAISRAGCNCESIGEVMLADECEKACACSQNCSKSAARLQQQTRPLTAQQKSSFATTITTITTTATMPPCVTSFATTAAKMFRNCCGGVCGAANQSNSTSSSGSNNDFASFTSIDSDNNNVSKSNVSCEELAGRIGPAFQPKPYFNALLKHLKDSQVTALLRAVKARLDPLTARSAEAYQQNCTCILVCRRLIFGEEPYVITCRLFFWRDLKGASELKNLPQCPNRDPVYVCCNPLHWCRILESETAPPPYQSQRMQRLEITGQSSGGSSENGENSAATASLGTISISSTHKTNAGLYVRITESLTTDGEERSHSLNWCEVAYWEMAQRVGERYPAKNPAIDIYFEAPRKDGSKDGMCLKDLVEKRTTPSPHDVQYTRQKIGLGVTLSQEADSVWLYNRSTVPLFVHSPTLSESLFRVCRVEPGECLRAFDRCRAQALVYPTQFPGAQTGPIDTFSMRISFGKGWGCTYKRRDITGCPCWLEVLITPQR